jgi:uncharacterized lipoprotein YmbA
VRVTLRVTLAILALALAGCAGSRATLVALPAAAASKTAAGASQQSGTVLLRGVVMPGYLDDYPVVVGRSGNTLMVSKNTEWAERFPDGVARVLRDALSRELGTSRVLIAGDGRIPDADLSVEFLALDPQQGALRLDAKWTFSCTAPDGRGSADRTVLEVPLPESSATAVATATSEALGRLAGVLAAQAECPGGNASADRGRF